MKTTTKIATILVALVLVGLASVPATATTFDGNETDLYCYKITTNVTVDGNISTGEWSDSDYIYWNYTPITDHYDANIYCYAKWDDTYIYFLVDLCPDNSTETNDFCAIYLDENGDGMFGYDAGAYEHYFIVYGDQESYTGAFNGSDWNTDDDPYAAYFGYDTSSRVAWEHRIIEFQINLTAINYTDTMGIIFNGYGTLAPNYFSTEGANASNFDDNGTVANWTVLHMENSQYLAGVIYNSLIPMMISIMGVVVTVVVLFGVVKILGKSFKGIK